MKPKILIAFGTRPEAIKMASVIRALKTKDSFDVKVCVFRQHKKTLDQMLDSFDIKPDYDLSISLSDKAVFSKETNFFTKGINLLKSGLGLLRFIQILRRDKPSMVLVQGDTSTAMLVALIAAHLKLAVGHVEAGLRTYDKWNPFPEEINRRIISAVGELHFAPTKISMENLLREGIAEDKVILTGNTVIDAIDMVLKEVSNKKDYWQEFFKSNFDLDLKDKKLIVVTAHRRENFGQGIKDICEGLRRIARSSPNALIVYPVHPNPNVNGPVHEMLQNIANIKLLPPLDYYPFVALMNEAEFLLTDSGGLQEEASRLGKPVLIMRKTTERPEALEGGNALVVGTDPERISEAALNILNNESEYDSLAKKHDLFGDGKAGEKIVEAISDYLGQK